MNELRSRATIEDIIQRILCDILPKFKPNRIRPAYQTEMKNGDYIVNEFGETEIIPFTPHDDFIYFAIIFDTDDTQSFTYPNGDVQIRRPISVSLSIYGGHSSEISLCVFSLIRGDSFMYKLQSKGLYLQNMDETINQMWELVNEEWFERHDFSIRFNEIVNIENPKPNLPAEDYNVVVDVRVETEVGSV